MQAIDATLIFLAIMNLVIGGYAMNRLRFSHPDEWERLGRPQLISNKGISNGLEFAWYAISLQYTKTRDIKLILSLSLCLLIWITAIPTMFYIGIIKGMRY